MGVVSNSWFDRVLFSILYKEWGSATPQKPSPQAVKTCYDSELGPGHPLVLVGKDPGGIGGPEMGKLKWVTESVSFSCQDTPKFTKSVSLPSAFRVTRFRLPVSGPLRAGKAA